MPKHKDQSRPIPVEISSDKILRDLDSQEIPKELLRRWGAKLRKLPPSPPGNLSRIRFEIEIHPSLLMEFIKELPFEIQDQIAFLPRQSRRPPAIPKIRTLRPEIVAQSRVKKVARELRKRLPGSRVSVASQHKDGGWALQVTTAKQEAISSEALSKKTLEAVRNIWQEVCRDLPHLARVVVRVEEIEGAHTLRDWESGSSRPSSLKKSLEKRDILYGFPDPVIVVEERHVSPPPVRPRRGRPPVSEKKEQRIVEALKLDPNFARVGKKEGVSDMTVSRIAKKWKLRAGQQKGIRVSPEKRAEVEKALAPGKSFRSVATEVGGISYKSVAKIAREKDRKPPSQRLTLH